MGYCQWLLTTLGQHSVTVQLTLTRRQNHHELRNMHRVANIISVQVVGQSSEGSGHTLNVFVLLHRSRLQKLSCHNGGHQVAFWSRHSQPIRSNLMIKFRPPGALAKPQHSKVQVFIFGSFAEISEINENKRDQISF